MIFRIRYHGLFNFRVCFHPWMSRGGSFCVCDTDIDIIVAILSTKTIKYCIAVIINNNNAQPARLTTANDFVDLVNGPFY